MVQGDTLKVVRSGDRTYMMARTPEFANIVKQAEDAGTVEELHVKIEAEWEAAFSAGKGTFPEKVEAATRVTCRRYGIVYYEGDRSHLRRVDQQNVQAVPEHK